MEILKKYFNFIPWIIIIVLLSALVVYRCSNGKVIDNKYQEEFKAKIAQKERDLVATRNDGEAKRQRWIKDSLEIIARSDRYKSVATKATKERDIARAKIQEIVANNPEVKDFVEKDSLSDQVNLNRIKEQELEKLKLSEDCRARLGVKDDEIKLTNDLNEYLQTENEKLWNDFRKQKNWSTFWKWVAGILGVGIIGQSLDLF